MSRVFATTADVKYSANNTIPADLQSAIAQNACKILQCQPVPREHKCNALVQRALIISTQEASVLYWADHTQ